jgi:uncharacterized metal-binding protein
MSTGSSCLTFSCSGVAQQKKKTLEFSIAQLDSTSFALMLCTQATKECCTALQHILAISFGIFTQLKAL